MRRNHPRIVVMPRTMGVRNQGGIIMAKMSDERSRALLKNREGTSDQRKPVEFDEVLLGILHRLDDGTSERKAAYDRLLAIENEMKKRGSRLGFARYLGAICIGFAAALAWQTYGEVTKQIIAAKAPELGWSPETKQMIASWVQTKPSGGPESTAVRPFLPETRVATVVQAVPASVVPKAPVIVRKLRRNKPPHQAASRKPMHHKQRGAVSVAPDENRVVADFNLCPFKAIGGCRANGVNGLSDCAIWQQR